ncbi:MAG: transcription elongation factor GreA [Syntrophomonadaceae bacterium]|nr:transcription elongation factor GreA [Syntrophomonadaceae bacterium]
MAERDDQEIILTKEGLERLEKELDYLKSTRREELAERIKQAIAFGDLSENSEYEDAKNEQAFLEGRILNLEKTLRNARLIEESEVSAEMVTLGSKVEIQETKSKKKMTYTLVSSVEANMREGKMSNESPVGKAIMGQRANTTVNVDTPSGMLKYKILKVEI